MIRPATDGATTRDSFAAHGEVAIPELLVLTVLCHPDLERVGDVAPILGLPEQKRARLSRFEPLFARPGGPFDSALEHGALSRRPLTMTPTGAGVSLDASDTGMAVVVDGERVLAEHVIGGSALARGVVIELAGRVALLLRRHPGVVERHPAMGLVGSSPVLERLRGEVLRAAPLPAPVLLRGESGSGKELVARAIHDASPRRGGRYIAVNMAAIPPSVAASELFGHTRGAFTGADKSDPGYFGMADGGTLFLDEIGETPEAIQPILLRVLDSGEAQQVGARGTQTMDVRIVAATDARLEAAVETERFRAALLHRLQGLQIEVPPLRDRLDDLGRLLVHFLRLEVAAMGGAEAAGLGWLSAPLVGRLARHGWPGNVRELRNVARRLLIRHGLQKSPLPAQAADQVLGTPPQAPATATTAGPRPRPADIDDARLRGALIEHAWHIADAAESLGVSRTTLYALIERSPSIRKAGDVPRDELEANLAACGGDMELAAQRLEVSLRGLKLRARELGLG